MATIDDIIKYVQHTPENTNPSVLKSILQDYGGNISPEEIEYAVEKYLKENPIQPTPIDKTLAEPDQAADAKATGDAIRSLSEEIVTTSESKVAAHNTGTDTHSDIRLLVQGLTDRLNALADSDDITLDQLSEVVAYIKSNRSLIEAITTSKVSVADIVDNLTTNVSNKPLSAAQGVVIKTLIDALRNDKLDAAELTNAVNTALAQAKASGEFDGADGKDGADGVGIQSVEKTVTSTEDGGTNVITVTKTDGTSSTFAVKNGSKGSTGAPGAAGKDGHSPVVTATKSGKTTTISVDGSAIATVEDGEDGKPGAAGQAGASGADGKSAYQYAQEGGYTGTETAFAEKLAQEPLIGTTNDLTPTQVYDAVSAGIPVKVQYFDNTFGVLAYTNFSVAESMNVIAANTIAYFNGDYILGELFGNKSENAWSFMATTLAQKPDIPTALPNPNALVFTGAVTGTYNGSNPVSVKIPSAVTDDHINSLIDTKLGVIENGSY